MIPVTCAECGENFEIGDEFAGLTEYCPSCGVLNDIPDPEAPPLEVAPAEQPPCTEPLTATVPSAPRGIPAGLWWTLLLSGIGLFLIACVFLFSNNWEDRNIQTLSDASNLGDVLMSDEDYTGAARQYRFVLDAVDHRSIDSAFILRLIDHDRRGALEAGNRLRSPPTTAPQTQPAPAIQPDVEFHLVFRSFQRDYEAFSAYVPAHPILFADSKGNWRRRQFFIWELAYDPPTQSEAPTILLHYNCASHITEPHADRHEAELDDNFSHDETPRVVHCQTRFEWLAGHWVIMQHEANASPEEPGAINARASLDDFYPLERRAFHAAQLGQ